MVILNQLNKNFPVTLFEMLYYTYACDAHLGFYLNLKCGAFFISTRYPTTTGRSLCFLLVWNHWRPQPGGKGGATAMPSPRSFEWVRIQTTKPTYPKIYFLLGFRPLNLENFENHC